MELGSEGTGSVRDSVPRCLWPIRCTSPHWHVVHAGSALRSTRFHPSLDRLPDQFCRSLDRLSDQFAKHCVQVWIAAAAWVQHDEAVRRAHLMRLLGSGVRLVQIDREGLCEVGPQPPTLVPGAQPADPAAEPPRSRLRP